MADVEQLLDRLASQRRIDPLAPVTVIAPSRTAAIQLRDRLAQRTAFAAVRFETLPRLAELIAAGRLASAGRRPLARPIADYVAGEVARSARRPFDGIADLGGLATTLRAIFRRLRQGGIRHASDVVFGDGSAALSETLRLYEVFRQRTSGFYDPEDLMDEAAAAVLEDSGAVMRDLGPVCVLPLPFVSAGADGLLRALQKRATAFESIHDAPSAAEHAFVLAPDPAAEAREVAREVLRALDDGVALDELAIFYGADRAYQRLLREALADAGVPAAPATGIPLIETPAGRGALALFQLPARDFSRLAVIDFLMVAPLRTAVPAGDGTRAVLPHEWDRITRDAGVTRGSDRWTLALETFIEAQAARLESAEVQENEGWRRYVGFQRDQAGALREVVQTLIARLEPLATALPAGKFISRFTSILSDYFAPNAEGLPEVLAEIEQLGTIEAVGGRFSLDTFADMLRANLEAAGLRERRLGEGVLVADYRAAAGLRFRRVFLCGAYEGVLPSGPGGDPLIDDRIWSRLRNRLPFVEDAAARIERARLAAQRAAGAATERLVWTCPLYEPGGAREYYPSPMMVAAAARRDPTLDTASKLRTAASRDGWLHRGSSSFTMGLRGPVVDAGELAVRRAIEMRRSGRPEGPDHPRAPALTMLSCRRSQEFTEWDGCLRELSGESWLRPPETVSPTSLERYAVCGFQYLCRSLWGLDVVEEPEERVTMDALARGEVVHRVLERFFREQHSQGRPKPYEEWTNADADCLLAIAAEELEDARKRGLTGLSVYSHHDARTIGADLREFLRQDTAFRCETGATPVSFEHRMDGVEVGSLRLSGIVDRIDRTPDGGKAWVIDYKTGSSSSYKNITGDDPLAGGHRLQLPAYLHAVRDAAHVEALYWFVSRTGGFEQKRLPMDARLRERFAATLAAIDAGVRAGAFPAVPGEERGDGCEHCRICPFDRICPRRRGDQFEEKQRDPAMAPWHAVAGTAREGAP